MVLMTTKRFLFEAPSTEPVILEINDDSIKCVPAVDGLRLLLFTSLMNGNLGVAVRAQQVYDFLRDCIAGDQSPFDLDSSTATDRQITDRDSELKAQKDRLAEWAKFEGVVDKYKIDIEGLVDMTHWLSDVYSERPTGPAQPSSAGQSEIGPSSEVSSSSPASDIPI